MSDASVEPRRELPRGIIERGRWLSMRFKDLEGDWRTRSTGLRLGQEAEAAALLAEVLAQLKAARRAREAAGVHGAAPTDPARSADDPWWVRGETRFADFGAAWIVRREAEGLRCGASYRGHLRNHINPVLGDMAMNAVRPADLSRMVSRMRRWGLAPKTVWNAYAVVRAIYRDAAFFQAVAATPCVLTERHLGPCVDADPAWRAQAKFSPDECASLMFDARIDVDRRVFYAIAYLTGRRLGEVAGLRFEHLDLDRAPLGGALFAFSYDQRRTKTNVTVEMPVHPVLARVLRAWRDGGFASVFGRAPAPRDFVVPRSPRSRQTERARSKDLVGRAFVRDLKRLDLRHRRFHDLRRSFISHIVDAGADAKIIESLTHPSSQKGSAFSRYISHAWSRLCEEVRKLPVDVLVDGLEAEVTTREVAEVAEVVAGAGPATTREVPALAAASSRAHEDRAEADEAPTGYHRVPVVGAGRVWGSEPEASDGDVADPAQQQRSPARVVRTRHRLGDLNSARPMGLRERGVKRNGGILPPMPTRWLDVAGPLAAGQAAVQAAGQAVGQTTGEATAKAAVPVPIPVPVPVSAPHTTLAVASLPAPSSQIPGASKRRPADLALEDGVVEQSAANTPLNPCACPFRSTPIATPSSSQRSSQRSSHRKKSPGKSWAFEVEAPGFEPGSASHQVGRLRA